MPKFQLGTQVAGLAPGWHREPVPNLQLAGAKTATSKVMDPGFLDLAKNVTAGRKMKFDLSKSSQKATESKSRAFRPQS